MTSAISSLARIWKICDSYPGCSFVWKIRAVYFSVKHSYLCNKQHFCTIFLYFFTVFGFVLFVRTFSSTKLVISQLLLIIFSDCAVHAGFENPSTDQLVTRAESQVLMWNIRTKKDSNNTCGLDILLSNCLSCFDGWAPITDTDRIKVFVDSSSAHLRVIRCCLWFYLLTWLKEN